MKKKITEINAVAGVMDGVFQQVDNQWLEVWGPVETILLDRNIPHESGEFIKFNYSLAALSINFRSAFDLFPRSQSERIFTTLQVLLQKQLGNNEGYVAVNAAILKYIQAYNMGLLKLRNPVQDVSILLYYKIGMENVEQKIVDESYFVPEPELINWITNSLMRFTGKWENLLERYEVTAPDGKAPGDPDLPQQAI